MKKFYQAYMNSHFRASIKSDGNILFFDTLIQDFAEQVNKHCTENIQSQIFNFLLNYFENPTNTTILDWIRFCLTNMRKNNLAVGQSADNLWQESLNLVALSLNLNAEEAAQMKNAALNEVEQIEILLNLAKRIFLKLPVAYATNKAWFSGKLYYVDNRVLIPRSPIEELIDQAFSAFFDEQNTPDNILDMCTGSGCLGIASAHAFPLAQVDLCDISQDAINVANINIENHNLSDRVKCIESDVWQNIQAKSQYDLIIANPPYVDTALYESQAAEYKQEPKLALEAGADGLNIAKKILARADEYLTDKGWLILEVGTSWYYLEQAFAKVPFMWLEFETGATGVLAISASDLRQYKQEFAQ